MGLGIWAPASYLLFLAGSLWTFSKIYRAKQSAAVTFVPWFPQHKSRDIYISLLSLNPPPPRPILIAALLRRAMDDVRLIWSVRDAKAALSLLLQRGQIGDELWERFLTAEKELELEIVEVVGEADTFLMGYGKQIFGIASEMVTHEKWKEVYESIPKERLAEEAKVALGVPGRVFTPLTHLTPSSLTLFPSNPIETAPIPTTRLLPAGPSAASTPSANNLNPSTLISSPSPSPLRIAPTTPTTSSPSPLKSPVVPAKTAKPSPLAAITPKKTTPSTGTSLKSPAASIRSIKSPALTSNNKSLPSTPIGSPLVRTPSQLAAEEEQEEEAEEGEIADESFASSAMSSPGGPLSPDGSGGVNGVAGGKKKKKKKNNKKKVTGTTVSVLTETVEV